MFLCGVSELKGMSVYKLHSCYELNPVRPKFVCPNTQYLRMYCIWIQGL